MTTRNVSSSEVIFQPAAARMPSTPRETTYAPAIVMSGTSAASGAR